MRWKKISAILCAFMLFSFVPIEAKTVVVQKLKTKKSVLYGVDQIIAPVSQTDIGKNARNFVAGFKTDKKDTIGKLQDIALYLGKSKYTYQNIPDADNLISEMEKGVISCYGYTLLSVKMLERIKVPYKVVNIALRAKNGDVISAHTCLLVKINDKDWVYFEPTKAAYYKEDVAYMGQKLATDELIRNTIISDYKKVINGLVDYDEVNTRYFYVIDGNKPIKVQYKEFK